MHSNETLPLTLTLPLDTRCVHSLNLDVLRTTITQIRQGSEMTLCRQTLDDTFTNLTVLFLFHKCNLVQSGYSTCLYHLQVECLQLFSS